MPPLDGNEPKAQLSTEFIHLTVVMIRTFEMRAQLFSTIMNELFQSFMKYSLRAVHMNFLANAFQTKARNMWDKTVTCK
jgi:hypothetical protein